MSSSAIGRRWYRLPTTWQVQNDLEAAGALSAAKLATESSNENIDIKTGGFELLDASNRYGYSSSRLINSYQIEWPTDLKVASKGYLFQLVGL